MVTLTGTKITADLITAYYRDADSGLAITVPVKPNRIAHIPIRFKDILDLTAWTGSVTRPPTDNPAPAGERKEG